MRKILNLAFDITLLVILGREIGKVIGREKFIRDEVSHFESQFRAWSHDYVTAIENLQMLEDLLLRKPTE